MIGTVIKNHYNEITSKFIIVIITMISGHKTNYIVVIAIDYAMLRVFCIVVVMYITIITMIDHNV